MDFETACETVKNLATRPSDDELLEVYGLYKQATIGDNNTDPPGMLDLERKAKWDAWNNVKGVDQEEAKEKYAALVEQLVEKYGKA